MEFCTRSKINNLLDKKDLSKIRNEFFVHSYHVELVNLKDGLFETTYSNKNLFQVLVQKYIWSSIPSGEKLMM